MKGSPWQWQGNWAEETEGLGKMKGARAQDSPGSLWTSDHMEVHEASGKAQSLPIPVATGKGGVLS